MDTRKELLKAVESTHPLNHEPILTIPELLDIIKKMPQAENGMDEKDEELNNIFFKAVTNGHTEIVEALLDRKMDPNTRNKDGLLVLNRAAFGGFHKIAKLLLAAKADVNNHSKNFSGASQTPLFFSVVGKNKEMVQLLLEAKADPNKGGECWDSVIGFAMLTHKRDITLMLTKAGAVPGKLEFSSLMNDYSDLSGNLAEGKTHEEIEMLLPAVNTWLSKGASLDSHLSLYRFLRLCDQRRSLVKDTYIKLCDLISHYTFKDKYSEDITKEHVLEASKNYLKKLQVVMEYKPKEEPYSFWLFGFAAQDRIAWELKFGRQLDARKVEALYEDIRAKHYPYRFFLGLAPAVQPQSEIKMTLNQSTR